MELDQVYDAVESLNDAMPYQNPVNNALFGTGAAAGYVSAAVAESVSGGESNDYDTQDLLASLGIGGLAGGASGMVMDGMQEAGKRVGKDYDFELGSESTTAAASGTSLGAAAGSSTVETVRSFLAGNE